MVYNKKTKRCLDYQQISINLPRIDEHDSLIDELNIYLNSIEAIWQIIMDMALYNR
jgi:hypothetical protein